MSLHREGSAPAEDRIEQASSWCARLAEGTLAPEDRKELDAWLASDKENARAFEDVARMWQSFDQTEVSAGLIGMRRDALDRFEQGHAARWQRSAKRRTVAAIAAGIAVMTICAGLWMRSAPESYITGPGDRRVVTLTDGSAISLDAQTRVDVLYSGGRRELQLQHGRAKFSVARDPMRPFSVTAANKVVVATGTQFSVELLAAQVHVILYHGSVDVLAGENRRLQTIGQGPARGLVPGSELIAPLVDDVAQVRAVDLSRSLSWESGQISFNEEPLSEAVERMNRYTDSPLVIADEAAGQVRISGTFFAGDTAAFIEGVTSVFPVGIATFDGRVSFVSTPPR
ncbi:FecR family protein [Povalibacter sp.]|uniref:FecR family protein n=1 Tax=Povalibacter sp. TaxID=1962978 RepID=UPI002F40DBDA